MLLDNNVLEACQLILGCKQLPAHCPVGLRESSGCLSRGIATFIHHTEPLRGLQLFQSQLCRFIDVKYITAAQG